MNTNPPEQLNNTIKETGKTIREIIPLLKDQPAFLFGIAVMLLAILALIATLLFSGFPQLGWFPYALLIFGVVLIVANIYAAISQKTYSIEAPPGSPIRYIEPVKVSFSEPHSATPMSANVLRQAKGGISVWVYVNPFGRGIRDLRKNHRYIISHDTNNRNMKEMNGRKRYINSFALMRGPRDWETPGDPNWKIELTNATGDIWKFYYPDSRGMTSGWHHYLIRWDHDRPLLEFLIDKEVLFSGDDYFPCWPNAYSDFMLIGGRNGKEHFVETHLWRAQSIYGFPDDKWVASEISNIPPDIYRVSG